MKKIAFINQRYGLEVNGGSEYYTRLMAEKLSSFYEVEVLTTRALSYQTWDNYYDKDTENIHGITVRRFPVEKKRKAVLQKLTGKLLQYTKCKSQLLNKIWIDAQGPYVPELIDYIKQNESEYDVFIFVTYLYYPTVLGLPEVAHKALLIPTAHDEYCIYFPLYKKIFAIPSGLIFLTEEEKKFVQRTFNNNIKNIVAGVGIDVPDDIDVNRFRIKYGMDKPYFIYVGRVDASKGCQHMIDFFKNFRQDRNLDLHLVIIGQIFMQVPECEYIHCLGFVSEQDKFDAMKGAVALWLPSWFESLSISVLEAMAVERPVLVNGKCEVLKGHCLRSNGGVAYDDYNTFCAAMTRILSSENTILAQNARKYVEKDFSWDEIIDRFRDILEGI